MGFWDGVKDFFVGHDAEKYKADPNASTFGGPRHDYDASAVQSTAANAGPASTTTAAKLDTGNYNQARGQQMGLADLLTGAARGEGPSGAGLAAQAQRDTSLSQAAALQAGRRGRSAVAGARMGTLAAQMGNQQASQNEAIGRANEMATARGQLGNVLGQVAGQDIGVAGQNAGFQQQTGMFNAGQTQQNNQFNAGLQQQTGLANQQAQNQIALANQAAQLGISQAELQARMQQEQMAYGNLDPGSQGLLSPQNLVTGLAAGATLLSDANAKIGIEPIGGGGGRQYIGPGMRQAPVRRSAGDYGSAIGSALTNILLTKAMERKDEAAKNEKEFKAAEAKGLQDKDGLTSMFRQVKAQTQDQNSPVYGVNPDDLMAQWRMLGVKPQPVISDEDSKYGKTTLGPRARETNTVANLNARVHKGGQATNRAREMLDELTPYSYFYKSDAVAAGQPPGRQIGVMAQDLEKTPAGRELVGRDPVTGYKNVDYLKGLPTMMAGLADVEGRLARLEKKR